MRDSLAGIFVISFIFISGCASIPPAAVTHANKTKQYHGKVTDATLKVYDSVTDTTIFLADKVLQNQQAEWEQSIKVYDDAKNEISTWRDTITDIKEDVSEEDRERRLSTLETKMKQAEKQFVKLRNDAAEKLEEDKRALTSFKTVFSNRAAEFRAMIKSHNEFTSSQIAKQHELLKSYIMVRKNREKFWGVSMDQAVKDLEKEASEASSRASDLVENIRSIVSELDSQ